MAEIKMTKESVDEVLNSVAEILVKKNADYGGASFDLGINGNMVHIWDKARRFRSLVEKQMKGEKANFESLEDTLRDIIGYAVIGIHILENDKKE
ncbi:MAG: nucleotide modification associated domain-containing protein [Tissierellia bacterium]|jgi:hypothetical protein|nr:nucleotide modification associated domain-containing protein [Tissierellia bacterium]